MRAKLAEKEQNYEQAIEDYGKVLSLDPSFFNAAYSKASCENIIGRYDDAIATYNLAFTKDENMPMQTFNSRLSSANDSPVRSQYKRGGSIRLVQQAYSQEAKPPSPFKMKSFDVVNAPESLVHMQRGKRYQRNKIARKTSNIIEVDSASEECDSQTEIHKKFEEEKIFVWQNEKPGSQDGYYSIP